MLLLNRLTGFGVLQALSTSFTTWNPADKGSGITLSGGNLTATMTANNNMVRGVAGKSVGKWYFEARGATLNNTSQFNVGIANSSAALSGNDLGEDTGGYGYRANGTMNNNNGTLSPAPAAYAESNWVCVAFDGDNNKLWVRNGSGNWNNQVIGSQNPATNTGGYAIAEGTFFPAFSGNSGDVCVANFGASAFTQTPPAGFAGWGA